MLDDLGLYLGRKRGSVIVSPALLKDMPNAYALAIEDDNLAPSFNDGDTVLVDPDKKPAPGAYVLLGKKGWQPHTAVLLKNGISPLVRDNNNGAYRAPGETVLGVIVRALRTDDYKVVA